MTTRLPIRQPGAAVRPDTRRGAQLFGHYDGLARLYDRARPRYPQAASRWTLGDPPLRVADVGAGTGKLTRGLVALGYDVVAVEPSDGMRGVLNDQIAGIEVLTGTAERLPLDDGSLDALVVGQAYHWFDHQAANREFARVLRPGGVVGLLFNSTDKRVPWAAEVTRILLEAEQGEESEVTFARQGERLAEGFPDVESRQFRHSQGMTLPEFLELVSSRPRVAPMPDEQRRRLLDELETVVCDQVPYRFSYPYVATVYRARSEAM